MVKTKKHRKHRKHRKQKYKSKKGGVGSPKVTEKYIKEVEGLVSSMLNKTSLESFGKEFVDDGKPGIVDTIVGHIIPLKYTIKSTLTEKKQQLLNTQDDEAKKALQHDIRELEVQLIQLTRAAQQATSIKRVQSLVMPSRTPRTPRS
jgi:hypothetical protein